MQDSQQELFSCVIKDKHVCRVRERGAEDVFQVSHLSGGKNVARGAAAKGHGLQRVKGSCSVLVTQEEAKGRFARKEKRRRRI